jgi:hypothetical protein
MLAVGRDSGYAFETRVNENGEPDRLASAQPIVGVLAWDGRRWTRLGASDRRARHAQDQYAARLGWRVTHNSGTPVVQQVQRWTGHAWSTVGGLPMPSAWTLVVDPRVIVGRGGDVWIAGESRAPATGDDRSHAYLAHGGTAGFTQVSLPQSTDPDSTVSDVSVESPSDVWVSGYGWHGEDVRSGWLLHWDSTGWRESTLPDVRDPVGHLVHSSGVLFACGGHSLLRRTGETWQAIPVPSGAALGPVVDDGRGGLWFAEDRMYRHYRNGVWSSYQAPSQSPDPLGGNGGPVDALYQVPGTDMIWGTAQRTGSAEDNIPSGGYIYAYGSASA